MGVSWSIRWPESVVRWAPYHVKTSPELTLQYVDVVQLKALQTVLHGIEDMLRGLVSV